MAESIKINRKTKETNITLALSLYGQGRSQIKTGIGFFDHMLDLLAKHSLFNLQIRCQGDLRVDLHHTIEDVGICIGKAIEQALGSKQGISRYGWAYIPMDDALARAVIDLSGRFFLDYQVKIKRGKIGADFQTELVEEFFRAVAMNAHMNLHLTLLYGNNLHHCVEALFKAVGRALRLACEKDNRVRGVLSTKGLL